LRLRLSCMWPLLFAVQTLDIVCRSEVLLYPEARVKISRGVVYRTMLRSLWCLIAPNMLVKYYACLRRRLTATLHYASKEDVIAPCPRPALPSAHAEHLGPSSLG
jgi:hypothetical protein